MTGDRADRIPRSFAFGPFVLVPERQLLLQGETPVRIGGRALDILIALVERPGQLVRKRELMARVWPNTVVDEGNLKVNVAALRRTLHDSGSRNAKYIATVSGRGYQFIAPVTASTLPNLALESVTTTTRRHNLPTGTTCIVGRVDAIDTIRRDLEASRLVSIVGPGGVGKTTVALAVAEDALGSFRDGIWLVDLSLLRDPNLMPNAIATAIGLAGNSANMLTALCESLRDRELMLLLDNCEHVIETAATCANQILTEAAGVKILATSREPLLLSGERVRRLAGLSTPPSSSHLNAEEALTFPAIQLFVDRATDRLESFKLRDIDAPAVAEICRRLDGLALAIEFAATRIDAFGVNGLSEQLDDRFRLMIGRRAGPERHRTLTAMLDWSYGLLSATEASLLRSVSVFAGVFDIAGASAVSTMVPAETADTLAQLAAKSLLATDIDTDGIAYRLLETTRTYCSERLRSSEEDQLVRRNHAEHVCKVLEQAAIDWSQLSAGEWESVYCRVLDDLRGALAWAGRDAENRSLRIRLTVAGVLLWNHFSLTEECRVQVATAVEELDAAGLSGTAFEMKLKVWLCGATLFTHGPERRNIDNMRQMLKIAVQSGDTDYHLRCLRMIAGNEGFLGEFDAAIRTIETFISVATIADRTALPDGETHLGIFEIYVGRLEGSRQRLERLYEHDLREIKDSRLARFLYVRKCDIGNVRAWGQWLTGLPDTAARTAETTIEHALKSKHELSLCNALAVTACPTFFSIGSYQECGRYLAMLDEQIMRHGIALWRPTALFYRAALEYAQTDSPARAVDGLEQAIAEFRAINHWARMPYYLGVMAEALSKCGRFGDAEATIGAALDRSSSQNERWCAPELLRIRAAVLTTKGNVDDAEAALIESMAVAREIGALSWQLRTANDLAKLWRTQSRMEDARRMLMPIYNEFTEGFKTRDLVIAADLIASLQDPEESVTDRSSAMAQTSTRSSTP